MLALSRLAPSEQAPLADDGYACWRSPEGDVVATFHHLPDGFLVRFLERADFRIAIERGEVACVPVPGFSPQAVEDLFHNQVMPLVRGQAGELVIHASAVAVDGGILAFAGNTGRGKSTLAAAFARRGIPFLSDDGVTLKPHGDGYLAAPNRPCFRLWQDSEAAVLTGAAEPAENGEAKSHVQAEDRLPFQAEPLPLRALYFLGSGEASTITIAPLEGKAVLAALIDHAFLLDVGDRARLRGHFEALGNLSQSVPAFSLDYPRDYQWLDRVIPAIVEHSHEEDRVQ